MSPRLSSTSTPKTVDEQTTTISVQHVVETELVIESPELERNATEEFHHNGSQDAQVAAVCMTLLLILLLLSVLYSRMWKLREDWGMTETAVPEGDIFMAGPQVNLKQLIQIKLRHLRHIIIRKRRRNRQTASYHKLEQQDTDSDTDEEELFVSNHVR